MKGKKNTPKKSVFLFLLYCQTGSMESSEGGLIIGRPLIHLLFSLIILYTQIIALRAAVGVLIKSERHEKKAAGHHLQRWC